MNEITIDGVTYILTVISLWKSSSFLSFQTREIAEQFLENFKDLIKQAGDLI